MAKTDVLIGATAAGVLIGPFEAPRREPVRVLLAGNPAWTGSVTVRKSYDNGANKDALTIGGAAMVLTGDWNEAIDEEALPGVLYYLDIAITSGSLRYRLGR